ncbi:MAG: HDOD domain-containing protein [Rhodothermales bacterium]
MLTEPQTTLRIVRPNTTQKPIDDWGMEFPPLPKTLGEVTRLIAETEAVPDTPKLAKIVRADPIVAAAVLKRINSSYYGLRRPVDDIKKAVFLLGFSEVCNIVISTGMLKLKDILKTPRQLEFFDRLVEVSLGTAYYANDLAQHLKLPNRAMSFTAGMMHNVGRLVMLYNRAEAYGDLWQARVHGEPPSAMLEQEIFGFDHQDVARFALERWRMSPELIQGVGHYLEPLEADGIFEQALAWTLRAASAHTETLLYNLPPSDSPYKGLTVLSHFTEDETAETLMARMQENAEQVKLYIEAMK